MDKFLLILVFIIKLFVIVIAPVLFYIFRKKEIKPIYYYIEIIAIIVIIVLYLIGFSYVVDSSLININNIKYLSKSETNNYTNLYNDLRESIPIKKIEADTNYKNHKNGTVYYYNGYDLPLAGKKIECDGEYDYYKYYSDIMTSTAMLLSTYFDKEINPVEVFDKANNAGLIKCGEPINKDNFFSMISNKYHIYFNVIQNSELKNYVLNGKPVLLETIGNGNLSCNESYFLVYDVNNSEDYLLLDPNNKSFKYICPEGTKGFGNILKQNYNSSKFSYSEVLSDLNRLIVIGGTR